jgi:hypothetical protein
MSQRRLRLALVIVIVALSILNLWNAVDSWKFGFSLGEVIRPDPRELAVAWPASTYGPRVYYDRGVLNDTAKREFIILSVAVVLWVVIPLLGRPQRA